jgi:hypothetical protein
MITIIVIIDSAVDVMSSTSSHATIVVTLELLFKRCTQICQSLLLLLELSLKLLELLQLGLCLHQRWWHGCMCGVHGVGWGAFTLIFIGGSYAVLPMTHEAFSRWGMTLIIRVKTLMKVVVSARELAPSP